VKKLFWVVYLSAVLLGSFGLTFGAEVPYTFQTIDIAVPGHPDKVAFPEDINDDGVVISTVFLTADTDLVVIGNPINPRKNKFKTRPITFTCGGDTFATSINKAGQITGVCTDGAFVRQSNGAMTMLSALGQNALGLNMSTDGYSTGHYCTPNGPPNFGCTLHGYTWHPAVGYQTIDYVDGRPGTNTRSILLARNKHGKILGFYSVDSTDPLVGTVEQGYFLYDNGQFTTGVFPLSNQWQGGEAIEINDLTDDDQVILFRTNVITPRLQLWDDGHFYDISGVPTGWLLQTIGGSNNLGQFVGTYAIQVGVGSFGQPIYKSHGFIATPAPVGVAKQSK
jgi:hypothetical protein